MRDTVVLGCDVGGTHMTSALVDLERESIIDKSLNRIHVNAHVGSKEVIEQWALCVEKSLNGYSVNNLKLALAVPGPFDYENGISMMSGQDKYQQLHGINVKNLLADRLGLLQENISFHNDAACFLQGEMHYGAGKGYKNAVGMTLGTGLGSAVYYKMQARDADLWNIKFLDDIAESYLSSRWFTKRYLEERGVQINNVKELIMKKDEVALVSSIFDEFGKNLALFIKNNMLSHKPEVIVLGGNISKSSSLFLASARAHLNHHLTDGALDVQILPATLGELSTIYGAVAKLG